MKIRTRQRLIRRVAIAAAITALVAPTAQAAIPDPGPRGVANHGSTSGVTDGLGRPLDPSAVRSGDTPLRPDDRSTRPVPRLAGQDGAARPETPVVLVEPEGFDWSDAAIGAGFALGVVLLAGGVAVVAAKHRGPSIPAH